MLDEDDGVVQRYSFLCLFSMDDTCDPFLLDCSQTELSPKRLMMINTTFGDGTYHRNRFIETAFAA